MGSIAKVEAQNERRKPLNNDNTKRRNPKGGHQTQTQNQSESKKRKQVFPHGNYRNYYGYRVSNLNPSFIVFSKSCINFVLTTVTVTVTVTVGVSVRSRPRRRSSIEGLQQGVV